jgi:hypothetical protein
MHADNRTSFIFILTNGAEFLVDIQITFSLQTCFKIFETGEEMSSSTCPDHHWETSVRISNRRLPGKNVTFRVKLWGTA